MELLDDYIFNSDGTSTKIETDDKFDRIITDRNKELEALDGGDKYDFATKEEDKLIYEVPKGTVEEYNNKLEIIDGGAGKGTVFTITDNKHADNIYRMIAGNSLVEYGKADYQKKDIKSDIWTNRHLDKLDNKPVNNILDSGDTLLTKTHSHPFQGNSANYQSGAYPTNQDISNLREYASHSRAKDAEHKIYSAYNPSPETLPFTISYTKDGPKEITNKKIGNYLLKDFSIPLRNDSKKNIPKEKEKELEKYYLWVKNRKNDKNL